MARILLVEDDQELAVMLSHWLTTAQYTVDLSADGSDGMQKLRSGEYDVVILDWGLPTMSGIDILKAYRREEGLAPVLFLTGKTGIEEKEAGLDSGADDYLTKPFSSKELLARVRALLRRPPSQSSNTLKVGDLRLDARQHEVTRGGVPVQLMPREFALLEFLMRNPGRVFNAESLLQRVWPADTEVNAEALRTYIMRLRQKLDQDGCPTLIETIPRVGYSLRAAGSD